MREKTEKELAQDERLKNNMVRIKNKFIVISGKGGVGKTTIAVNLAYGLALKDYQVGILDVDIHGPNIAKMLGIEHARLKGSDVGIEPVSVLPNLKAVSIALIGYEPNRPVIWRGPLKMSLIKQFLSDVNWGELDYLIVDSPPGTGDEPLSVCQLIPDINGAIIVTTPQDVAILDSRKAAVFAKELKVPILGIIENMSGLICPHCKNRIDLFKVGGGKQTADDLEVPFLGTIPIEPEMVELSDSGKPFIQYSANHGSASSGEKKIQTVRIVEEIVQKIIR